MGLSKHFEDAEMKALVTRSMYGMDSVEKLTKMIDRLEDIENKSKIDIEKKVLDFFWP
ncbi:hypothetical protein NDJ22_19920 [Vibrio alginolyticus]|uniref:hypothetical protein n=1 Tax=Vibrio alginolyticus TaxID=663 RepID=UPI00215F5F21|nr:hypothetical protein [Vibrio alginolyticus]MCS0267284.1 hypothetical protein [Vibrio alginolyticus]